MMRPAQWQEAELELQSELVNWNLEQLFYPLLWTFLEFSRL